jgi:hypothetical protein
MPRSFNIKLKIIQAIHDEIYLWNCLYLAARLSIFDILIIDPLSTSLVNSSYIGIPPRAFLSKLIQTLPKEVISLLVRPKYEGVKFANSVM